MNGSVGLTSFNEARADSPGKFERLDREPPASLASMRPGLIRPGNFGLPMSNSPGPSRLQ